MSIDPKDRARLKGVQESRIAYDRWAAIAIHPQTSPQRRRVARLGMDMELMQIRAIPRAMATPLPAGIAAHVYPGEAGRARHVTQCVAAAVAAQAYHEARGAPSDVREAQVWRKVIIDVLGKRRANPMLVQSRL